MKKAISVIFFLILLSGCSVNNYETEVYEEHPTNGNEVVKEDMKPLEENEIPEEDDTKGYYGEWEISKLFFSDAPSTWGKEELEEFIGMKLVLSSERVAFNGTELSNPKYGERVILPRELSDELVTTYESLGLNSNNPPIFVTIHSDDSMDEESEWISDSVIYRFFVKDSNTLIAENRNAYFILVRVK